MLSVSKRLASALLITLLLAACGDSGDDAGDGDKTPTPDGPVAPSLDNLPASASGHTGAANSFALMVSDANAGDVLTVTADAAGCGFEVTVDAAHKLAWTCSAAVSACEVAISVKDAGGLSDAGTLSIACEDTAPSVSAVAISPDSIARIGDPLTCGYTFTDADGDADASTVEWLVGDVVVAMGPSFDAYQPRDVITCRVTPRAGELSGAPVTSAPVTAPDRVELVAGRHHSCATKAGVVYCWGNGANGQLGRFTGTGIGYGPDVVEGDDTVATTLSAGGASSCAIMAGALKCWGYNAYGELGIGGTREVSEPRQVTGLTSDVTAVAMGERHACAVMAGALSCWGDNNVKQLGDDTGMQRETPAPVAALAADVSAVAVGGGHSCAIQAGALKCWGAGFVGQLGVSVPDDSTSTPTQVTGLDAGVSAVVAAGTSTCAIHSGALKCWGYNEVGQLGDGTQLNRDVPTQVVGLAADVSAVALGATHACAIQAGALKCWGDNASGQLGDGTRDARLTPTQVTGLDAGVTAVAVGESHTCAVQLGKIKCWGNNMYRQLGSAQGTSTSPIDVTLP
jgi:alpha-tubulin suppressor-like RCC1 family protein